MPAGADYRSFLLKYIYQLKNNRKQQIADNSNIKVQHKEKTRNLKLKIQGLSFYFLALRFKVHNLY